jgi:hypothetical protein
VAAKRWSTGNHTKEKNMSLCVSYKQIDDLEMKIQLDAFLSKEDSDLLLAALAELRRCRKKLKEMNKIQGA